MKKIITLVLAVALLMTSVMAFAETKGTPNINSFAKMTTKTDEAAGIITITMDKMVDRLLVNWVNKGAEPEELALDENMQATAIIWGHEKAMPGSKPQKTNYTWNVDDVQLANAEGVAAETYIETYAEALAGDTYDDAYAEAYADTVDALNAINEAYMELHPEAEEEDLPYSEEDIEELSDAAGDAAGKAACDEEATEAAEAAELMANIANGILVNNKAAKAWVVAPSVTYLMDVEGKSYILDEDGEKIIVSYNPGHIYTVVSRTSKQQTTKAYPSDHAYLTVQGEWAVYYNRAGKIVGVELFEGQF